MHTLDVCSVQSLSRIRLFATPWIAARQASLSITNSWSSLKLMSMESVMPSSHLILCRPLLLLPPIPPSIRVFSNELTLHMRWPKYWSFSLSISPSNEHPGLVFFRMDWLDLFSDIKMLVYEAGWEDVAWLWGQVGLLRFSCSELILQNVKHTTFLPFESLWNHDALVTDDTFQ